MKKILLATSALVVATPAAAQVTSGNSAEDVIVVTAQKREQDIRDVPLAVTVFDQDGQDRLGIQQFDDLADFVPGLEVQEQSANNPGFVIRGITSDSGEANIEPRVAIFQDGVPVSRSRGSFFELFDSQVEVVRGPQPTLFGRSALIGALNVTSARPELDETVSGKARLGFGNFDYVIADGMVNVPLSDTAAFRVAGRYKKREGYVDNLIGKDLNGFEMAAIRGSLLWTPTADLEVTVIGNYQKDDNPGTSFKSGTYLPIDEQGYVGTLNPSDAAALSAFGGIEGGRDLGLERDLSSVTALVDYQINDTFTFSSVTSYREFDSSEVFDPDGFNLELFAFAENAESEQFFQELRVGFDNANGFTGFVGASIFDEEGHQQVPLYFGEAAAQAFLGGLLSSPAFGLITVTPDGIVPPANAALPPVLLDPATGMPVLLNPMDPTSVVPLGVAAEEFTNYGETTSYDIFADATYAFTDRFELTAGIRYTYDDKSSGYSAALIGNPSPLAGGLPVGLFIGGAALNNNQPVFVDDEFDGLTYRVAAKYDLTDDLTVFANYGHGRRPEVLAYENDTATVGIDPSNFTTADAEEVDAFDIGLKGFLFDGVVGIDLAAYYYDYANFQTTVRDPNTGTVLVENAGNASGPGFEGAVTLFPADWANLFVTYAYNGVEFDDEDDDGNPQTRAGNRFRLAPENTVTIGAEFTCECKWGEWSFVPVYAWKDETFFDDDNDLTDAVQDEVEDGYALVDLHLTFRPAAIEGFAIELFGENVTDEEYLLDAGNTGDGFGIPTFIAGPPRTYGVILSKDF